MLHGPTCQCVACKCKKNPMLGDIRADVERERTLKQHIRDIFVGATVTALSIYLSEKILKAIRK